MSPRNSHDVWDHNDFAGSSIVVSADYNPNRKILEIEFTKARYRYTNIPADMWDAFKEAPSPGAFVSAILIGPNRSKPRHTGVKIQTAMEIN